jgi:hypothetical protein
MFRDIERQIVAIIALDLEEYASVHCTSGKSAAWENGHMLHWMGIFKQGMSSVSPFDV